MNSGPVTTPPGSLFSALRTGSTCAACVTAATGGECPNCGIYWVRDEAGKMVGLRSVAVDMGRPGEHLRRDLATVKELRIAIDTHAIRHSRRPEDVARREHAAMLDGIRLGYQNALSWLGCPVEPEAW